jgi:hypothetical protein
MEQFVIDPTIAYDVVELPSKGIHYANNKKSVRVAYLTASDENILSSQNLLKTNTVVEELLKRKILDKDIEIDDLADEDRNAILIFLRNTSFGSEYTFYLRDPKTDEEFTSVVDLSEVTFKDFTLTPDEMGEFKFHFQKSNVDVTFKFLTKKQLKEIEKIEESWNGLGVAPVITKQLEMMIKSIAGNRDPMNIHNFVEKMPIKDSQEFRKFVKDNKPNLDLVKSVTAPSGELVNVEIGFGVEFFRPFYGV